MECFKHAGVQAVGLCKFCLRGICHDCAIEAPHHLACSEQHAEWAEGVTQVQQASMGNVGLFRSQRYIQPIASVALIALGLVIGYLDPRDPIAWVFIGFGGLMGVVHIFAARSKKSG